MRNALFLLLDVALSECANWSPGQSSCGHTGSLRTQETHRGWQGSLKEKDRVLAGIVELPSQLLCCLPTGLLYEIINLIISDQFHLGFLLQ